MNSNNKSADFRPSSFSASLLIALLVLLSWRPADAQWDFGIAVDLGLIYSDNIRLAPEGFEESDTALLIMPELRLTTDTDRLEADLRYRPEAYFYKDLSDANEVFHALDAQMTATLAKDALYFYASAVNSQTLVSPDVQFTTSNLPIIDSRVDFTRYELRPYWEQDFGFATILAEVAYIDSEFDERETEAQFASRSNVEKTGRFSLNNIDRQQGFAWGLDYFYARVEYEDIPPWDYQQASANMGYWFSEVFRLFGSGGLESSYENLFDPSLEDDFWEVGFQYRPSQRLNLELAAGQRSFGDSMRGDFLYEFRSGQTSISYSESPSTRGQLGSGVRPLVSSDNLDGFLDRPGDTDIFVLRRGDWDTSFSLAKTEITLRVFGEAREQRISPDGEPLGDEEYYGAALRIAWRVAPRSTIGLQIDDAARKTEDEPVDQESDFQRLGIDYTYRMSERFAVIVAAIHSEEESQGLSALNYEENQLQLMLRGEF